MVARIAKKFHRGEAAGSIAIQTGGGTEHQYGTLHVEYQYISAIGTFRTWHDV